MEVQENEENLGQVGRIRHFSISRRDTFVNDIKNSTVQGIVSFSVALTALTLLLLAVYFSYRAGGEAGYAVGAMGAGALFLSVISIVFGILGLRNRNKTRHYVEKRGIAVSAAVIVLLGVLFVRGLSRYLGTL